LYEMGSQWIQKRIYFESSYAVNFKQESSVCEGAEEVKNYATFVSKTAHSI